MGAGGGAVGWGGRVLLVGGAGVRRERRKGPANPVGEVDLEFAACCLEVVAGERHEAVAEVVAGEESVDA